MLMVANYCLLCVLVMCRAGGILFFKALTYQAAFHSAVTLEIQILRCVWRVLVAF